MKRLLLGLSLWGRPLACGGLSGRLLPCLLLPALLAAGPRLDRWRVIGPGGGGAQFIPTVSPNDPARVLVRCDMTGTYITDDAGASWRMFNLRAVTNFFVFDPVDPGVLYAGGLGLWRSTDAGASWRLVYPTRTPSPASVSPAITARKPSLPPAPLPPP